MPRARREMAPDGASGAISRRARGSADVVARRRESPGRGSELRQAEATLRTSPVGRWGGGVDRVGVVPVLGLAQVISFAGPRDVPSWSAGHEQ